MKKTLAVLFMVLGLAAFVVTCASAAESEKTGTVKAIETTAAAVPNTVGVVTGIKPTASPNALDAVAATAAVVPNTVDVVTGKTPTPLPEGMDPITATAAAVPNTIGAVTGAKPYEPANPVDAVVDTAKATVDPLVPKDSE